MAGIASNDMLGRVAENFGLGKIMELGPSMNGQISRGMYATAIEALIGAVHLDGHAEMKATAAFIERMGLVAAALVTYPAPFLPLKEAYTPLVEVVNLVLLALFTAPSDLLLLRLGSPVADRPRLAATSVAGHASTWG